MSYIFKYKFLGIKNKNNYFSTLRKKNNNHVMCCNDILKKSIRNLKLNSKKVSLLNKELNIYTCKDLILYYPNGYIYAGLKTISELKQNDNSFVQIIGKIIDFKEIKKKNNVGKILIALLVDKTGYIELIWFKKISFFKRLKKNILILVFGKKVLFKNKIQIVHPIIQKFHDKIKIYSIYPTYSLSKNLKKNGIDNFFIMNLLKIIIKKLENNSKEINNFIFQKYTNDRKLISKKNALIQIHFPESINNLIRAKYSIKFEKLFLVRLFSIKKIRGKPFLKIGKKFNSFYKNHLPFDLTEDQKNVFREIRSDLKKPIQMNRLLQGEVGSGKTIIAMLAMLLALDNGFQSCIMAPTEILAIQHYNYFIKMLCKIGVKIALLTRSTSYSNQNEIYKLLIKGKISFLIGTHSLIQEKVKFKNLGIAIIDEQQKFGVEQREKICKINNFPHVLIMTATPIPRTLAKVFYKNLSISIIKNKPIGKIPIKTIHFWNEYKHKAFQIIENEIIKGRQIYIVYPIVNSEKHNYKNLITGYQEIIQRFKFLKKDQIGFLHGKMNYKEKEIQMNKFLNKKTKIIVTTTIIEVGINVVNVSVILIENANVFGLSQLHQLRGRVGRGIHQSYCILLSEKSINPIGLSRINKMCQTNNGLEIAKEDLKLRGGGNLTGNEQSGKKYLFTNIFKYNELIKEVFLTVERFTKNNPNFLKKKNNYFHNIKKN
ncbi:ATP-dependent DNA helicase RecG [Blattabacterium cuenoti]|uniref:ATP-dependent DNA helicase RecG n=1 Tax=Blattabacterium cuenoti TaxID=1653831 RepID=UPI001EEC11FD|nr:DEAD/DEAH box helicase [Blattabacterium cuenoti]